MGSEQLEQPWTDPTDPVESGQTSERSMGLSIGKNDFSQTETDLRQARELSGGCQIDIDALTRPERLCLAHGAIALSPRGSGREPAEELDLAWRLARTGNEIAHALPYNSQGEQQQHGARFGRGHHRRYGGAAVGW
jgi:hypothetical protein